MYRVDFQLVERIGSGLIDLVDLFCKKDRRVIWVLIRNKSPYPIEMKKVILSIPYSKPVIIEKKFLFWKYPEIKYKDIIAKEPVFGKVLPGDVWDWSIVLFKRPFVAGRYMLEFMGKVIGGRAEGGVAPVFTFSGDLGVAGIGGGELSREFKDVLIIDVI